MRDALAQYGAALDVDGFITRNGKTLSIKFVVAKGRLRAEDKTGRLVASFPNKPESVHSFKNTGFGMHRKRLHNANRAICTIAFRAPFKHNTKA